MAKRRPGFVQLQLPPVPAEALLLANDSGRFRHGGFVDDEPRRSRYVDEWRRWLLLRQEWGDRAGLRQSSRARLWRTAIAEAKHAG